MFCINCGKQIPDGAKFCSGCGASQNPDTATETPAQETVTPVQDTATPNTPEINLSETFSDYFGSAQNNVQPVKRKKKSKLKKLSGKVKGFLITLLVFLVTFGVRHALENGMEGFFGFIGDSIKETQAKTYEELDALMAEQELVVTGYNRGKWERDGKTGPLIQAYMKNNSGKTIKSVEIAIATWDKAGTPVNLTTSGGGAHYSNISYLELNDLIWPDGVVYDNKGLGLDSSSKIPERIQVIPIRWTYSDGETGYNAYKEDWLFKYENKQNERSDLGEIQFPQDLVMSEADLKAALQTLPLVTTNCEIAQWDEGDLLCATVENKGTATIKTIQIVYATWDADNNPVIVTGRDGKLKTSNICRTELSDLSVAPGQSYGADNGAALHSDSAKVAKFDAIAYYYEDTEGNVWENPYYYAWLNLYEAK